VGGGLDSRCVGRVCGADVAVQGMHALYALHGRYKFVCVILYMT